MELGSCPEKLTLEPQAKLLWSAVSPHTWTVTDRPSRAIPRAFLSGFLSGFCLALVASGISSDFCWSQGRFYTDKLNLKRVQGATSADTS